MNRKVSLIHCADLHLDAAFTNMGRNSFSRERRQDLKKTVEKIISLVSEKNADYLILSGDLYEHQYASRKTIQWLNEQFEKLRDSVVILVPGNHDPFVKNSWYRTYPWNPNVHILTTQNPQYRDDRKGVYFYGIGFDTFRQDQLPAQKSPEILADWINLCLFHGTVDMAFTQQAYNPVASSELLDLGFDYYALGHFHARNEVLAEKGILNPGSPEPLGFDEQGVHGVYWVTLEKEAGTLSREYAFLPVQQKHYRELDLNISGMESETQIQTALSEFIGRFDPQRDILKINLTGRRNPGLTVDINLLEQLFEARCFCVKLTDTTRPGYDLEELAEEKNITGVFIRMMRERIEGVQGEERKLLETALYLGLEALMEEKVEISPEKVW